MINNQQVKTDILGVKVNPITMGEVVVKIQEWLKDGKVRYIVTPNPEIITFATNNQNFKDILNQADLAIPDGQGLLLANKSLKSRVTGTDLMLELCKLAPKFGWKLGFLGGQEKVAEEAAKKLEIEIKGLKINFAESGGKVNDNGEWADVATIPVLDILFVGFGFPKQEFWIEKYKNVISAKLYITVGGAFDYFSGKVKRAPLWIRNFGLEWLYRLIMEPKRLGRQLAGSKFFFLVLKEKILKMI